MLRTMLLLVKMLRQAKVVTIGNIRLSRYRANFFNFCLVLRDVGIS